MRTSATHYIDWHQARAMYATLPMKAVSILPDEGMAPTILSVATLLSPDRWPEQLYMSVSITPKPERKPKSDTRWGNGKYEHNATHRVLCRCIVCDRDIPFGRMQQHFPIHTKG